MIDRIVDVLQKGRRYLISMHKDPDGDGVGSSLAIAGVLREMGKDVVHYNPDPIPYNLRFLPGAGKIERTAPTGAFDATIICDTAEFESLGEGVLKNRAARGVLINIDHHRESRNFGDLNYLDSSAASAGILVYRILNCMGNELSRETAECLYASILTDTGSFRYDSTNPESLRICSELIEAGVSPWNMSSRIYETQPASRLMLLARVLSTFEQAYRGRVAILTVTREMVESSGGSDDMIDGFVNHARAVEGVEVALILIEHAENVYYACFRSRGKINLVALGKRLGCKSSPNGAGVFLNGGLAEVKENAVKALGSLFSVAEPVKAEIQIENN